MIFASLDFERVVCVKLTLLPFPCGGVQSQPSRGGTLDFLDRNVCILSHHSIII